MRSSNIRFFISLLLFLHQCVFVEAQNSENGSWLPAHGNLNVLIVYAEVVGDPNYESVANDNWKEGKMPNNAGQYLDEMVGDTPQGYISHYFHQASFGDFKVGGFYFPELIQIDQTQAAYHSFEKVVVELNRWYNDESNALHPFKEKLLKLDAWTMTPSMLPKKNEMDSLFDCIVVVWRVNSKLSTVSNSGYVSPGNQRRAVFDRNGVNCQSEFVSHANNLETILRHEISHALYGGNNFHTGGAGAGRRTFIPSVTGWSNLSSWDNTWGGWNSWDRNRMGWKNPKKKFLTSAFRLTANGLVEQSFDDSTLNKQTNGTFALRDFNNSGDVIRFQLPGPDSPRLKQYLWLEFHSDSGRFDINSKSQSGVYVYVQIGKDDKTKTFNDGMASPGNYTFPLPASGRWDFDYAKDSSGKDVVIKNYDRPNPISGNHFLMRPMIDRNENGKLDDGLLLPEIIIDGDKPAATHYAPFGNDDDAFKRETQTRMNVSTNPSTNTLITYSFPANRKNVYDSDTSFITGLDIRMRDSTIVLDNVEQPIALVDVAWSYYNVSNNVRWCGTIALKPVDNKPNLIIENKSVLTLDRSLTPMMEKVNTIDTLNNKLYFSPLTSFTLYPGTQLTVKKGSALNIINGSKLYVHKGATLVFEKGSKFIGNKNSIVYLD